MATQETFHPKLIKLSSDLGSVVTDEYGTFDVSMIDVESERDDDVEQCQPSFYERLDSMCSKECLLIWLVLSVPFKLLTYKTLLFHAANFIFSVVAIICVFTLSMGKVLQSLVAAWGTKFRRIESWTLQHLLQLDCALYNFISPRDEHLMVYSPSIHMQHAEGLYGMYAQLYFGGVKLLATGIPGAFAVFMFIWSLQNVIVMALRNEPEASATTGHLLSIYYNLDMMMVVAVVAIYASVILLYVFVFISQQLTIFFCSQYLLYGTGLY
ncbi:unnamed protein product [Peronospora effusa]|nr:unnamed protein product [Peronospora effusa]